MPAVPPMSPWSFPQYSGSQAWYPGWTPTPAAAAPPANPLIDPLTGRTLDLSGLREGKAAGEATVHHGFEMDTAQEARRQAALATLNGQANNPLMNQLSAMASQGLTQPGTFDEALIRRLFARGADGAETDARRTAAMVRSNLGGRGISPSSGLAAGLAATIERGRTAAVRGVEKDVTIAKLQQDSQDRALAFQNALSVSQQQQGLYRDIASIENQEVPGYGQDALQGLTELIIERHTAEMARKDAKKANKMGLIGSVIGGLGSILGGI